MYAKVSLRFPTDPFDEDLLGQLEADEVVVVIAVSDLPPRLWTGLNMYIVYVMSPNNVGWMYMLDREIDREYSAA
jgi:hypothetical protein